MTTDEAESVFAEEGYEVSTTVLNGEVVIRPQVSGQDELDSLMQFAKHHESVYARDDNSWPLGFESGFDD